MEHVHRVFDANAISALDRAITENEVLKVPKAFSPDKCPGPDGWPSEFFIHFFHLMGAELTQIIEHIRLRGVMPANLNSTFIALIPKMDEPQTFVDFRPIALCNILYKITSKIIAEHLKVFLSDCISKEQFGFLKGRSIHDAVAISQEVLHSIHSEKRKAILMKIDLHKAYDSID